MSKVKGTPKTGGRKKGTPNKRTRELQEIMDETGFCPARSLILVYRKAWKEYRRHDIVIDAVIEALSENGMLTPEQLNMLRSRDTKPTYLKIAGDAASELMNYAYPKRKAIEVSGKDGGPLDVYLMMTPEERARRLEEIEKRLPKK